MSGLADVYNKKGLTEGVRQPAGAWLHHDWINAQVVKT